jgi:hypothetical protein
MGMQAYLEQISSEQLAGFIKNPQSAYEYYLDELNDEAATAIPELIKHMEEVRGRKDLPPEVKAKVEEGIKQYQAALQSFQGSNRKAPAAATPERKKFSLEKAWHILHYALNGTAEPGDDWLSKAILGGTEIPDRDGIKDYGPLRYLSPKEVEAVAAALAPVDPQSLTARLDYNDAEKKQIYLSQTLKNVTHWDYLPELFASFRDFYTDASRHGKAMLLSIT